MATKKRKTTKRKTSIRRKAKLPRVTTSDLITMMGRLEHLTESRYDGLRQMIVRQHEDVNEQHEQRLRALAEDYTRVFNTHQALQEQHNAMQRHVDDLEGWIAAHALGRPPTDAQRIARNLVVEKFKALDAQTVNARG